MSGYEPFAGDMAARQRATALSEARNTARRQEESLSAIEAATLKVHEEVERLAIETARAQRLAVRVGVATATLGAILGGFAGAIAARIVGS
jgi:hypothetical protein